MMRTTPRLMLLCGCAVAALFLSAAPSDATPIPSASVTIVGSPPTLVTGTNQVTFSFVGVDRHPSYPYYCKVELVGTIGAAWQTCSSPWTGLVTTDGNWRFTVAMPAPSLDSPVDYVYAWHDFTVVNHPPTVAFTSTPKATSTLRTPSFGFSVQGAAVSTTCALDGSAGFACSSPVTLPTLTTGGHTLTVTATNPIGTASASYSWQVVNVSSPPTIDKLLIPGPYSGTDVTLSWVTSGTVDVEECMFDDNGRWFPCTSPVVRTGLSAGEHAFAVRVINGAGSDVADGSWFVDPAWQPPAPSLTVTSKPASITRVSSATFRYTLTNATSARCTLDGNPVGCSTTTLRLTGLALGSHTVTITPVDATGRTGSTWQYTWVVYPYLKITSRPLDANVGDAVIAFAVSPTATVTCSVDYAPFAACTSPLVLPAASLAPGTHTVRVRASEAGLTSTSTVRWTQS